MTTTYILYAILYAAALVFVIACLVRAIGYARLPLHLRWELYPVPHEEARRAEHGGSYFESGDWWTRPLAFNRPGELKSMLSEIFFLKGLWEFNRRLWYRSFLFHWGLYLLIGTGGLLFSSAFVSEIAPGGLDATIIIILHDAYLVTAVGGTALTLAGAAGLLVERLTNPELKLYTTPGDIFNLAFFIVTVAVLGAGYWVRPPGSPGALALAEGALTFDGTLRVPPLLAAGLVLGGLLAAYIPMTHMSHFIGKYFTYHAVRWDDEPNRPGGRVEQKVAEYLAYRPAWSAPHVGADGSKTWAEIAMTDPVQGGKK